MKETFAFVNILLVLILILPTSAIIVRADSGDPTIQDVGITFWSTSTSLPGPITASTGGYLRLWYFIDNPNPSAMNLILGATIRDPSENEIPDEANDKIVTVDPGLGVYSRYFEIPRGIQLGSYDVAYGIWEVDWSVQYDLAWKLGWLTVTDPVEVSLSTYTTDGQSNVGNMKFDGAPYTPSTTIYAETRMHSAQALPPSGYILDHWEMSGQVDLSDEGFGYANVYVRGSGGITAVFRWAPTFDISVATTSLSVAPGATVTTQVYFASQNGFDGSVSLILGWSEGRPGWVIGDSFNPNPVYLPADGSARSTTLTISVSDAAAYGTYYPEIFATAGSINVRKSVDLELNVLKRYTVTFQLGQYDIIVDGNYLGPGYGTVSYTWLSSEYHYFYMTSPFHGPYPGETTFFREWNDGYKSNYRSTSVGGIPFEDATYYPLCDTYFYVVAGAPYGGGSVTISPSPGEYGYLWHSVVTITAVPSDGYTFDHWDFHQIWGSGDPIIIVQNPFEVYVYPVAAGHYDAIFVQSPPSEKPVAVLTLEGEGDTFDVGDTVVFYGGNSYSPDESDYIISYFYNFGDGQNSGWTSNYRVSHTYDTPGTYSAELKVIGDYEIESDWSAPVQIQILPIGDFEISVSPRSQIGQPSSSVYFQIAITSKNGFSSSVDLDVAFSPNPLNYGYHILPTSTVTPPPDGLAVRTLEFEIYPNTPLKTFTITVTAHSGAITKTNSTTLSVEKSLEVPYQNQGDTGWCGPTSLAMVLRYFGYMAHSWDYAWSQKLSSDTIGVTMDDLKSYVVDNYPDLTTDLGYYGIGMKDAIFDQIKTCISMEAPVILNLGSPPIHNNGHYVVVVGYNETGIFINDPSGAFFTVLLQPPNWAISSYNHAYVDWNTIETYIATLPLPSIMPVSGNSNPKLGTIYLEQEFKMLSLTNLGEHYFLDLDRGLTWKHVKNQGTPTEDNTIDFACDRVYWTLHVANSGKESRSFTASASMLCPDGRTYSFPDLAVSDLAGFSQTTVLWNWADAGIPTMNGLLRIYGRGMYFIVFGLKDSKATPVDSFVSAGFYLGQNTKVKTIEKQPHLYLHVYDEQGNHIGLSYVSGQVELGIPGSYYSDDGNGTITIVVPQIIDLRIVIDAQYAEEPIEIYDFSVILRTDSGVFEQIHSGNITAGEKQTLTTKASETGLSLYFWQYIFKDSKRGTELRINALDKYFQFTVPGKDFGVKQDPNMKILWHVIIINYGDSQMRLIATALDDCIGFCVATAWDKKTGKVYMLIDKPNPHGGSCNLLIGARLL
jgi:hypothetical protein